MTKGLFLKVDSHHQIQLGTVYRSGDFYIGLKSGNLQNLRISSLALLSANFCICRGKQRLDDDEVMKIYQNTRLSVNTLGRRA